MDNPRNKTGNLGYTRRNIKQSKNIAHYPQTNITNANKSSVPLTSQFFLSCHADET
jgi:hypothetical protein